MVPPISQMAAAIAKVTVDADVQAEDRGGDEGQPADDRSESCAGHRERGAHGKHPGGGLGQVSAAEWPPDAMRVQPDRGRAQRDGGGDGADAEADGYGGQGPWRS